MKESPKHIPWFRYQGKKIITQNDKTVYLIEFEHTKDPSTLSSLAKHFREHYCLDEKIDILRRGTGLSRAEYLKIHKFPDQTEGLGPSVRSGDFAEILVADYFEFLLKCIVPRIRYSNKAIPNESTKGTDVIAFKLKQPATISPDDILYCIEVKAQFSRTAAKTKLQEAIKHSSKDKFRIASSLNAMKQRLLQEENKEFLVETIERFQNFEDKPYNDQYTAVAFHCDSNYDENSIRTVSTNEHLQKEKLSLLVFKGKDMMNFVHQLYEVSASEA